jgi:3-oxoacyl-[acyl-carrier protein] reductase
MFSLNGKRAFITGATGGIGQEIARALYTQGATVFLTGTREETLKNLAFSLGDRCHFMASSLKTSEDVKNLLDHGSSVMGGIDILVNNAGITRDGLMMMMKEEDYDEVLHLNLKIPFLFMKLVTKIMLKQKYGRIINMGSVVGTTGNPGQGNYCASKAGLVGMTKAFAAEVASRGITANVIAPGFIETPMTDKLNDDQKESLQKNIPCRRLGIPTDIAAGVVFLASQESAYITGQTLHINGGMSMI